MGILEYEYEGVTFYFIDNESYFWGDRPYGDWYYDLEKFSSARRLSHPCR